MSCSSIRARSLPKLLAAARKEGSSPSTRPSPRRTCHHRAPFEKKHGIKVDIWRRDRQVLQRTLSEAAARRFEVM